MKDTAKTLPSESPELPTLAEPNETVSATNWSGQPSDAEQNKNRFVEMVERLVLLREAQYNHPGHVNWIIKAAKKVAALNLPSNPLRAAALFVDFHLGFSPRQHGFRPPAWVTDPKLLPKGQRGSLACSCFQSMDALEASDCVVLTQDIPTLHLTAGMAGAVRESPSEDNPQFLVEFGAPEGCGTVQVRVPETCLRTPRPGDLLENYRW